MNLARCAWHALRARWQPGYRSPLGIYLCLTARCNSSCRYCNFAAAADDPAPELATSDALRYVSEFADAGVARLNITGGEPMLHDGLPEIIEAARDRGMFVTVSSNGQWPATQVARLRRANLVMLSCDGNRETHDLLCGSGSFDRLTSVLDALRAARISFSLTAVITAINARHLDDVIVLAARYGTCANFALLNTLPGETSCNHIPTRTQVRDLLPAPDNIRAICDRLIARKRSGAPIGSSYRYLRLLRDWGDYAIMQSPQRRNYTCMAARLYAHLYYDHHLYPCGQTFGSATGIDLRRHSFRDAFTLLTPPPDCHSCRTACDVENNYLYNLSPDVIGNWLNMLPVSIWSRRT